MCKKMNLREKQEKRKKGKSEGGRECGGCVSERGREKWTGVKSRRAY
jgi:hypothetical protein